MWGAISWMGDELQELATREDNSESADEEQEGGSEISHEEASEVLRTMTNPIPLFGILPEAPAVSFRTFDDASVRDSVSLVCRGNWRPQCKMLGNPWRVCSLEGNHYREREISGSNGWITASIHGLHSVCDWRGRILGGQAGICGHDLCRGLCALDCCRWSSED